MISPRSILAVTVTLSEAVLRDLARLARRRRPTPGLVDRTVAGSSTPLDRAEVEAAIEACQHCGRRA